jgi:PncC family amidohydrolase
MNLADLNAKAAIAGALLLQRRQTISISESSSGGLISAALLSVPGASGFYYGGAVVYTARARAALVQIDKQDVEGMRGATEEYAALVAERTRALMRTSWALCETGAAGPSGNPYGDPAGHTCFALAGPLALTRTLRTGLSDRPENMVLFAAGGLDLLIAALNGAQA